MKKQISMSLSPFNSTTVIKRISSFVIYSSAISIFVSCSNTEATQPITQNKNYTTEQYNNTKGYWPTGQIITKFYCPDAVTEFPPIDLKTWDKTPAVSGRLPTYEETMNGTSIHHYGEKATKLVKAYNMQLPKLARYINPSLSSIDSPRKDELVVVVQIVQTPEDTIVGYRFLSGGVGGSVYRDFHFLTDEEVKEVVNK